MKFDPPELHEALAEAIEVWKRDVSHPRDGDFSEDIVDVTVPGFDAAALDDRTITPKTEFGLFLPKCEDTLTISYGRFIKLAKEQEEAQLTGGRECQTGLRYLLRVAPANDWTYAHLNRLLPEPASEEELAAQREYAVVDRKATDLRERLEQILDQGVSRGDEGFDEDLADAWHETSDKSLELATKIDRPTRRYYTMPVIQDVVDATCSLTTGFTVFGVAVAASGDYDDSLPPILDGEMFVEVQFRNGRLSDDTARYVADAFLFELSGSFGLDFEVDPRPTVEYEDPEELDWRFSYDARPRPLLLGMGMPELLRLYNKAAVATDEEIKILYLAKVVEYVSQTVVEQRAYEAIRAKLLSPRSLSPDAAFVAELRAIVEEQRAFRKDREAVRQATIVCCDATELSGLAPPFLGKLRETSPGDAPKKKEEALAELGASLFATRNRIAHAKANYVPTGEECPAEQMAAFAECAKLAAQQAVRWYHSRHEDARVL